MSAHSNAVPIRPGHSGRIAISLRRRPAPLHPPVIHRTAATAGTTRNQGEIRYASTAATSTIPARKPHLRILAPGVCGSVFSGLPAARHFIIPPGRTCTFANPRALSCLCATWARCPLRQISIMGCSRSHSSQAPESRRRGISSDPSMYPAANSAGCRTSISLRFRMVSFYMTISPHTASSSSRCNSGRADSLS